MSLRPFMVTFGAECSVLAWAESSNKARSICVGFYTEYDDYLSLRAFALRHMHGHPKTPAAPCVMDGDQGHPNERELVDLSFVHRCYTCGGYVGDCYEGCDRGFDHAHAFDTEIRGLRDAWAKEKQSNE